MITTVAPCPDVDAAEDSSAAAARADGLAVLSAIHENTLTAGVAARWPGWGRLSRMFDTNPTPVWERFRDEALPLLTDEAYRTARESCDTSFYTPDWLAGLMWQLLTRAGFEGGTVFYPGFGAGRLAAAAPAGMPLSWVGVEADQVTAAVAAARFPDAQLHVDRLQKVTVPTGGFDLAIGNVPYAEGHVRDSAGEGGGGLHNYFLRRMVQAVRHGGLICLLTSRHAADAGVLHSIPGADLSALMRLPAGTFPGTDVAADLVLLRRHDPLGDEDWYQRRMVTMELGAHFQSGRVRLPGAPMFPEVRVARYWLDHPEAVAGSMSYDSNPRSGFVTVTADDPRQAVAETLAALPVLAPMLPGGVGPLEDVADAEVGREGSFVADGEVMLRVRGGLLEPVKASAELWALVKMRDQLRALLDMEADHTLPDEVLAPVRGQLADTYRAYVAKWGPLGRGVLHEGAVDPETGQAKLSWKRPAMGGFRGDPDAHLVWSLERFDPATGEAAEAAILSRRVNLPVVSPTRAEAPAEALSVALAETGRVDEVRIAGLLNCPAGEVETRLGELVFRDPASGRLLRACDYLSGDVVAKLEQARAAGWVRNITALEQVVPEPLLPGQITGRLGVPWIGAADVEQFLTDTLGAKVRVQHCPVTGRWELDHEYIGAVRAPLAFTQYGTPTMSGYELAECALNQRTPVVTTEVCDEHGRWRKVRDGQQTMAAQEKLEALQEQFSLWLWQDPDRSARLCADYNRRFNSHVPRKADGSYLTFPGMSAAEPLWEWQTRMVDRVLNTPAVLCGHAVGAGKTRSMLGSAWMLRRHQIASKPMIVVPNHLLEQIAAEAIQMFPTGRWLIAGKDDLSGANRRLFAARCATGDWDGVIITHAGFGLIPVHPSTERGWLTGQKDDYEAALRNSATDHGNSFSGKQIARKVRGLETRLENLRGNADSDTVWWEQLGIDHLMIDEADAFLRLPITTGHTGFSMGASKRATDLLLKLTTLRARGQSRPHFAAFTGTPWRNSIVETFVWQTYLQPHRLRQAGIELFDHWAAQFVTMKTRIEPAPDGSGLRIASRPTRFQNAADLFTMFDEVADILPASQLPIERPPHTVTDVLVDPSEAQQMITADLIERSRKLQTGQVSHDEDNMLAICGDGRRSALDPALLGVPGLAPKVTKCAQKVAELWAANQHRTFTNSPIPGVLQVVFCDQGTPHDGDTQTYGRLRAALITHGVPGHMIRFVHDATDDKAKARLFQQCRTGEVQVLIASTAKAGTGTNMQHRLAAVHHLDAPWRPADIEQREGRALRPGNHTGDVEIVRYVTRATFDTYMWAVLTRKASWIEQAISHREARDVDDIGEVEIDYSRVAAAAAGDERLFQRAELTETIRRLRTVRAVDAHSAIHARKEADAGIRRAETMRKLADQLTECFNRLTAATADPEADMPLHTLIGHMRKLALTTGSDYGTAEAVWWRGLRLSAQRAEGKITFTIGHGYREVERWSFTVREVARRKFPAALIDKLNGWCEQLPQRPARLLAEADRCEQAATHARHIAEGWRFPRQAELDAAVAALAVLDAELATVAEAA